MPKICNAQVQVASCHERTAVPGAFVAMHLHMLSLLAGVHMGKPASTV